jgi:hypothetical protein
VVFWPWRASLPKRTLSVLGLNPARAAASFRVSQGELGMATHVEPSSVLAIPSFN